MQPIEQMRLDTEKLLVLLTYAVCASSDSRVVMQTLMANLEAMSKGGHSTPGIETSGHAMLLAASSAAVKQNPGDAAVLSMYQDLRSGQRH